MSVKLRLSRMGRGKRPIYAVIAADSRSPRDGRFIEDLGRYYPVQDPAKVALNDDRLLYWLEQGAQPTETVRSLLSKQGLMLALHMKRKGKSEDEILSAVEAHRASVASKAAATRTLTPAERRREALKAEQQAVEKKMAEEAAAQAKAAEEKRKAEEEARKQAEAEAAAAHAEAKAAAEAEAKAAAEATTEEAPAAEAEAPAAEAAAEEAPVAEAAAEEAPVAEAAAEEAPVAEAATEEAPEAATEGEAEKEEQA